MKVQLSTGSGEIPAPQSKEKQNVIIKETQLKQAIAKKCQDTQGKSQDI